jgi:hypothetical protein
MSGARFASQLSMRVAIFSTKHYDRVFLEAANATYGHELFFFEPRLTEETTPLAAQFPVVCVFVNDQLSAHVLNTLAGQGTRLIALRSAGFNACGKAISPLTGCWVSICMVGQWASSARARLALS